MTETLNGRDKPSRPIDQKKSRGAMRSRGVSSTLTLVVAIAGSILTTGGLASASPATNGMWKCSVDFWCAPTTTNLNMRNAPNQNSPSVDVIPTGKYAVLGCWYYGESIYGDNIWYNSWDYQFDNGNLDFQLGPNGYMAGYYLETGSDPNPAVPYCNMG